jgi:hypothetical protein
MTGTSELTVLKVSQWLTTWGKAAWAPPELAEPAHHFFIGSVSIAILRKLAGVNRRQLADRKQGAKGAGYQRAHQTDRSKSIAQYLRYGYPLSTQPSLDPVEHSALIHPGWLPTSILVNIIPAGESRRRAGKELQVGADWLVSIDEGKSGAKLTYPTAADASNFKLPNGTLEPIEIIDGQHRLFSLDEIDDDELQEELSHYQVPVIFFHGLSPSWQAYLFWVINVEPKKINPSLAFDLYPELRSQSWLESGEGIKVYQEHRAQELTEVLWRHERSPWRNRIELHGNRIEGHVSNAAFIRSLMASFVRRWGNEDKVGGLFGSIDQQGKERVLRWKRSQQAAFLISCWNHLEDAVAKSKKVAWVIACAQDMASRSDDERVKINPYNLSDGFAGPTSLMGSDQGVRAVLTVFNALCQVAYSDLQLESWEMELVSDEPEDNDVSDALEELNGIQKINDFLRKVAFELVERIDWRTSSSTSLNQEQKQLQAAFRGSSGYSLLQRRCLEQLSLSAHKDVAQAATVVSSILLK